MFETQEESNLHPLQWVTMCVFVRRGTYDDFPLSYLSDGAFRYLFPFVVGEDDHS